MTRKEQSRAEQRAECEKAQSVFQSKCRYVHVCSHARRSRRETRVNAPMQATKAETEGEKGGQTHCAAVVDVEE